MRFVIVTGMSGAGKSTTMKILEDLGYFCVDNLPIMLMDKFVELAYGGDGKEISKIAVGLDVRSGHTLVQLDNILDKLSAEGKEVEVLFLEASNSTLIKRYKETRRSHPLNPEGRVDDGIAKEREMLSFLKEKTDYIINTDSLLVKELRVELEKIFVKNVEYKNIFINILSFGFKYGVPRDSDLVFDVRFLPNPYYIEDLRPKTGDDKEVRDYVMNSKISEEFYEKLGDMIQFLVPQYIEEGKQHLTIGIGCTGGRHRSVTISNLIYDDLVNKGYRVVKKHRDSMLR